MVKSLGGEVVGRQKKMEKLMFQTVPACGWKLIKMMMMKMMILILPSKYKWKYRSQFINKKDIRY